MLPIFFLGIDVAKATFHAALIPNESERESERTVRRRAFANTAAGHAQLAAWLRDQDAGAAATPVHACLEATGTYGEELALFLAEQGHTVSVVNPAAVHHFGKSQLCRAKTDKADALLIARFCRMFRPAPWTPPAPEVRELQALVRRLEALAQMRQMEVNRLAAGVTAQAVRESLSEHVAHLDGQVERAKEQIREHIERHPQLKRRRDLLVSIPGVADSTAAHLLAELADVAQFAGARQVTAFAGLAPRVHESGTSVRGGTRLSKSGTGRLRKALFFPAMVAMVRNPVVAALRQRLLARGKSRMLIVGAAMRKLLVLAYGVLKSGRPFDPARAAAGT